MENEIDFLAFPKVVNSLIRFGRVEVALVALQGAVSTIASSGRIVDGAGEHSAPR